MSEDLSMGNIPAKILLVDDDARSLMAMEALLFGPGRTIVTANSGPEALRQVLRHDFAVILLDVRMPRVDGFEAAELIRQREQSRYVPIIFLSAVDKLDEDVFRGLASGAVDYLFKPVVPEVLQSKVSVFVELYRMRERAKRQAVRQGEERFRLLVDSIKDYSILLLGPDGTVKSWNPGTRLIEGYEADEVIGRHVSCFYTAEDIQRGVPEAELELAASVGQQEDEGWRVRKDGSRFWSDVVLTALKDETGRLNGFARVSRDLTERKAAEERLRTLASELEQRVVVRTQELLHSQGRLRDLATELTLTEQRERRRLAGELHDYLAQLLVLIRMKIGQACSHLKEGNPRNLLMDADRAIIDSLNYTRSLVAELAPPALQEFGLIEGFAWLKDQMQNHGLIVTLKVNVQSVSLPDDRALLIFQSTRELLFNVLKHAGTTEADLSIDSNGEGELAVAVSDKGGGFHLDQLSGETGGRKRFGLFSVRERTEAMGGRLVIETALRQGTTVTLFFPYRPVDSPVSTPASRRQRMRDESDQTRPSVDPALDGANRSSQGGLEFPQGHALRVILADDHAMVRQGLRTMLDSYEDIAVVGEASNGEEAIEMVRVLGPDVVVMDVNMAKMDGIEATRRIKHQWPSTLIVGLSVSTPSQVESLLLEAGASCYVSKEAAADQLYGAIVEAVKREPAQYHAAKIETLSPVREQFD